MNETRSTRGSSTSGIPASGPSPWTTFSTPGGRPASRQSRPSHHADTGACSDGFKHRAVAAEDRGERFPGDVRQRRVERDQERGDADRPSQGQHGSVRHRRRRRTPVRAAALARDEEAHLDGRIGLAAGQLDSLARLGCDDLARLLAPLAQQRGDRPHDVASLDGRARAPFHLRFPSGGHRSVCVGRPRARDAAEIGAVRGARLLEPGSARGRPLLAGDEVRHLRRYHQADQPPSTTRFAPVTYDEPSEARNTTAPTASETSIRRPSGERAANASTKGAG